MNAYIYQANIYCEPCIKEMVTQVQDIHEFDSDEYAKGPFSDGGGESDYPTHCGLCHDFLENPLTTEGEEYVKGVIHDPLLEVHPADHDDAYAFEEQRSHEPAVIMRQWREFYGYLFN